MRYATALLLSLSAAATPVPAETPFTWASNFQPPGTHETTAAGFSGGVVRAVIETDDAIYIGGDFDRVGSVAANHVAKYNRATKQWSGVGTGTNGTVNALALSGSLLFAGGDFSQAGGSAAGRLAVWDGANWNSVGNAAFDGPVRTLLVHSVRIGAGPVGSVTPRLLVGGAFASAGVTAAANLAVWDGLSWSVPGGGVNGPVNVLAAGAAVTAASPDFYAGGEFTSAGGNPAERVAHFSGGGWSALGSGLDDTVYALAWDGGTGVYAGGSMTNYLARWTGSAWVPVAGGTNSTVRSLAWANNTLYAGGSFDSVGGGVGGGSSFSHCNNVASYNSSAGWSVLDNGVDGLGVMALSVRGSHITAVGDFNQTKSKAARNVAEYDGTHWQPLVAGDGVSDSVLCMTSAAGLVYAGGDGAFSSAGQTLAKGVAAWNPATRTWSALGAGLEGGQVNAVTSFKGAVIAGGGFTASYSNGVDNDLDAALQSPASGRYLARWNGTKWEHIGPELDGAVLCFAELGDRLYVGGRFTGGIGRWDPANQSWTLVGGGVDGPVNSLTVYQNAIAAGGEFTAALSGTVLNNAGVFGGGNWIPLSGGLDSRVYTVCANGTDLYLGGDFHHAGTVEAHRIARWANGSWQAVGDGFNDHVYSLTYAYGILYAGGSFTGDYQGNTSLPRLAWWAGGVWRDVGGGVDGDVMCLNATGTALYAGGYLETAGSVRSVRFAEYTAFPNPVITHWQQAAAPNEVDLRFLGIPGRTYRIEGSTDLINWSPAGAIATSLGVAAGSPAAGVGATSILRTGPRAFYRVRLLQ